MLNNEKEPMLQWFKYDHLPMNLQGVGKAFYQMANHIVDTLPRNPERTAALRKLLEARDAAVRCPLYEDYETK